MPRDPLSFRRPCPVCGAWDGVGLGRLSFAAFDDSPLGGDFTLAGCPGCALVFYDFYDSATQDDSFSRYYKANDYYASAAAPGSGGDSEFDRQHQRDIIARLSPWLPPDLAAPIMEVGCGRGGLLAALAETGYGQLYGVDLSEASVAAARSRGLRAEVGPAERLPFPSLEPRLLIYSHVFEHLPAPHQALAEARRRLAPGGLIYIEVPDAENYGGGGAPFQDFYLEHVSHFSQNSLAALLDRAAYRVLALDRADFHLPGGRVQQVLWAVAGPLDKLADRPAASLTRPPRSEPESVFQAVEGYLNWSADHPALERLARLAEEQTPVFVWGLSQLTMLLLASSPLGRCRLRGFIDRDPFKQTRRLMGRPVLSPSSLAEASPEDLVLLTAWGQEAEQRRYLDQIGFKGRAESLGVNRRPKPTRIGI